MLTEMQQTTEQDCCKKYRYKGSTKAVIKQKLPLPLGTYGLDTLWVQLHAIRCSRGTGLDGLSDLGVQTKFIPGGLPQVIQTYCCQYIAPNVQKRVCDGYHMHNCGAWTACSPPTIVTRVIR